MANLVLAIIALCSLPLVNTRATGDRPSSSSSRCGKVTALKQRIVGGEEAVPGSHPWIVSIQIENGHSCGGSLIRVSNKDMTDIVVTAAHCIYDEKERKIIPLDHVTVTAGAHLLNKVRVGQQTVAVKHAEYHPDYDYDFEENDIAVLILAAPIDFNPYVQPICLPELDEKVAVGVRAIIAGWGIRDERSNDTSNALIESTVVIKSGRSCSTALGSEDIEIDEALMLCAGSRGVDTCQGDSGGPLETVVAHTHYLQGVTSFGIGCGRPRMPGIYARVSHYVGWIRKMVVKYSCVTNSNLHRKSYCTIM